MPSADAELGDGGTQGRFSPATVIGITPSKILLLSLQFLVGWMLGHMQSRFCDAALLIFSVMQTKELGVGGEFGVLLLFFSPT